MTLDINYTTTNPRNVDKILETAIEQIQNGAAGKVFTPDVTDEQRAGTPGTHKTYGAISP